MFIDTHTHLYQETFENDIEAVINRCESQGVKKLFLPAIDSTSHLAMLDLEKRFPNLCIAMMGLHPCSVKEDFKNELKVIESWLGQRKWCAIGEIGLDFYWDKTFTAQQYEAFELQINLAKDLNIPIVIHTRNATAEAIQVVSRLKNENLRGIFHCFSGDLEQALQAIDLGFLLGIGGVVTFKNGGLDKIVEQIPLEHLVLETDAPYLAPVPYRGKRNESAYIPIIAQKVADLKQTAIEEVARITTLNAERVFGVNIIY